MSTTAPPLAVPERLRDRIVLPDDPRYGLLRSTYTTVAAPAGVVLARDAADVAAALDLARDWRLPLSVRSGGHGLSGRSSNDGGLVIDLSRLDDVAVLDRDTRLVRVGAGARWGRVAEALAPAELAISSGDHASVAAGGPATAGGIGWFVRDHGLTIDHVRAVELVLPDGTPVRADRDHHRELFWAVRGAGGGVGVVLAFEIEAKELTRVTVAQLEFAVDPAGEAVLHWATALADAPRAVTTAAFLVPGGPAELLAVTAVVAADDPDVARAALEPLLTGPPRPLRAGASVVPYPVLVPRAHLHPNVGQQPTVTTSALFGELTGELARELTAAARAGVFVQLRSIGGAMNDVPADATAFAHRHHRVFATGTLFPPGTEAELARRWAPVRAHADGAYVNFETRTDVDVVTRAYPGATGERVAAAWRRYDPDGLLQPVDTPDRARPEAAASPSRT